MIDIKKKIEGILTIIFFCKSIKKKKLKIVQMKFITSANLNLALGLRGCYTSGVTPARLSLNFIFPNPLIKEDPPYV